MPLMTHESIAARYPHQIEVYGQLRHRIDVNDVQYLVGVDVASLWHYLPLRAAENLDCWRKVHSIEKENENYKVYLKDQNVAYISPEGFLYVDESTLALINNYR